MDSESRSRQRKRRLVGLATLLVIGLIGWMAYSQVMLEPLKKAMAEADRLDPGWRWEDLNADRAAIPDTENALQHAIHVYEMLPGGWPRWYARIEKFKGVKPASVSNLFSEPDLACNVRLPTPLTNLYRTDVQGVAKPLAEARQLAFMARGSLPASSTLDFSRAATGLQEVRTLLLHDAIWQAEQGQSADALLDIRAGLRLGIVSGDDPHYSVHATRLWADVLTMGVVERVLAQVSASDKELATLQELLEESLEANVLLFALRGERASQFALGKDLPARYGRRSGGSLPMIFDDRQRGLLLALMNRAVEHAKLPPGEQFEAFVRQDKEYRGLFNSKLSTLHSGYVMLGYPVVANASSVYFRRQAAMATAVVAIAAERFRLQHGRWPKDLTELAPLIRQLPVDPYDGQPLRLKLQPDGLIVYSVGRDRQDAGGLLKRDNPVSDGVDIGFQLWDVQLRRQGPAAPPAGAE